MLSGREDQGGLGLGRTTGLCVPGVRGIDIPCGACPDQVSTIWACEWVSSTGGAAGGGGRD